MKTTSNEEVDLSRYPYRGILTEIAREEGVTRQAIQQAARTGNPHLLGRIAAKIEERRAMIEKHRHAYAQGARERTVRAPRSPRKNVRAARRAVAHRRADADRQP